MKTITSAFPGAAGRSPYSRPTAEQVFMDSCSTLCVSGEGDVVEPGTIDNWGTF